MPLLSDQEWSWQGKVFMIYALVKILSGEQLLRANNLRPIFRSLFGLDQGGFEIYGGKFGGSGLNQALGGRLFGDWHMMLVVYWPGSREILAPRAQSLPSMFS